MSDPVINRMMYKYEVADLIGTTPRSLRRWMSKPERKMAMHSFGVEDTAHQLTPKAINYIIQEFGTL